MRFVIVFLMAVLSERVDKNEKKRY